MTHEIRSLTPVDARALFEVRRDGLIDAPLAFLSTPTESRLSVDGMRDMLTRDVVFGAGGDRLLGMAGVYTEDREKTAHKAHLWGMYVRPEARGRGLAGALLARVIAHARSLDAAYAGCIWGSARRRSMRGDAMRAPGSQPGASNPRRCATMASAWLSCTWC